MKKYIKDVPNYDKFPVVETSLNGVSCGGWQAIGGTLQKHIAGLQKEKIIVAVECYHGILDEEVLTHLQQVLPGQYSCTKNFFLPEQEIDALVYPDVTNDEVFGYVSRLTIDHFFDPQKLKQAQKQVASSKDTCVVYGCGATTIAPNADILVYADMARWEIQQRFRSNKISNLGTSNHTLKTALQYKRAFYVDWRVCDRIKKTTFSKAHYILDTNQPQHPKMVSGDALRKALELTVQRPFRVVPFFDPGPWGGQWMKEYCDLNRNVPNFAWCFDCVPEENSLLFRFDDLVFETPSMNLVYFQSGKLLGDAVQARFGDEFPIRFDFLDTMDGGNLSLQVHPTTEYIQEKFGMPYTQDESYYLLDAGEDACVYLGLKNDADPNDLFAALEKAQEEGSLFDAEDYVAKWPAKKHDHVLIPAGTIHCSGKNCMVLEISATPFNFTFKLWDWGRMGLDGKPRPINIRHGKAVLDPTRTASVAEKELINVVTRVAAGEGWVEERTGLHEREFIETRRHWFTKKVTHKGNGSVQVLNLVEGREAIVESPDSDFDPFVVHYAETFIVPAAISEYTVRPFGESEGKQCGTIKAFVRTKP